MDPENEGDNGAVEAEALVLVENGEPVSAIVSLPEGDENSDSVSDDGNGEGKSDAVAIAEIVAEKEIAIAAIEADVAQAQIEAESERVEPWQEGLNELRENMRELNYRLTELAEAATLSQAEASQLTPTPQPELEAVEVPETDPNLTTPQFMSDPTSSTGTEPEPESAGVSLEAAIAVPGRKRRRLI